MLRPPGVPAPRPSHHHGNLQRVLMDRSDQSVAGYQPRVHLW
jgi:hypothetical protein